MADPRSLLKASWDRLSSEEREHVQAMAMDLWRETLGATKERTVKGIFACQKCDHKNLVEVPVKEPDLVTRTKALEILANQAYGKPAERLEVDMGSRTLEALERLSTLELARMAGVEVVDGEIVELDDELPALPPAA